MGKDQLSRKLAVILHADVVGSTSLVQKNEALAHQRIQAAFNNFSGTITAYGGVAREIRGDAVVAEFDRASDAVTAAVAFQAKNEESNNNLDDDIRPLLRIGISLGEVIIADSTITGAGVVLAQRLEQLAESGGVVVQGSVSETVPTRMPFEFENLGEQVLKGFEQPVRAYIARLRVGEELPTPDTELTPEDVEPENLEVPNKPSIAVLSFENLSGDHEQEYFSDGISEDLTTALSRFDWLFVIARNSAFTYKGMAVDVKQVGRELGVRYVLEGSVRRAGDRVRVNAQLIDTDTDSHVWAERFDRQMIDIFDLQDDIVASIAATVAPEITLAEIERSRGKRPNALNAWDRYLQAIASYRKTTPEDIGVAIALLGQATDVDPEFANAYALLSRCHMQIGARGWVRPVSEAYKKSRHFAEKAVQLSPSSPEANHALAFVMVMTGEADQAITVARRAVELNPNFADAHTALGQALIFTGDLERGLDACHRAERSNPRDNRGSRTFDAMGHGYFSLGKYEQAIEVANKSLHQNPSAYGSLVVLACTYAQLGRKEEAKHYVDELLRLIPRYTLRALRKNPVYVHPELIDNLVDSMSLAGLPE
jgi:adenylate cyclase